MKIRVLPVLLVLAAGSASAGSAPVVATIPPLSVSADPDRTYADIPLAAPAAAPAALTVLFADPVPAAAVRAVTVHLRCGTGWRTATLPAERARGNVRLPFGAFSSVEGIPGPVEKADLVRISLWRRALQADTPPVGIEFAGLTPPADIAVVRATEDTAPGETAFAARLADRLERLLSRAGVPFDTLLDTDLSEKTGTASRTFLFLPYAPSLSPARLAALRAHVAAGGRVVAFYNASPELSELIGLAPPRYMNASPGWTAMSWNGRRIPHLTEHLLVPGIKDPATTVVAATWIDADGKDTRLPALAVTRHGALFAHIPPLAYPAAQDMLLLAILGTAVPPAGPASAAPASPPPREAGSVPEASASGSTAGSVPEAPVSGLPVVGAWVAAPRLPAAVPPALNTLFAYLAAVQAAPADRRSAAHVWLPLLDPVDVPGHRWLDPTVPADRAAALRRVRAAARLRPAGIHFDYVRTQGGAPASPAATAAVTSLLREAAALVRELAPAATVSAAVFPTPAIAATVNQDWPAWIKEGLVDFVAPMIYEDDPDAFRAALAQCLAAAPADRLVAGIGTGADEAQVDAAAFRAEVAAAAAAHLRGVAFFALDDALLELLSGIPAAALADAADPFPSPIVLSNGVLRAEIVPAWAGRLMFFGRPGGANALWTWPEAARFTVDENGRPVWRNIGGEKTWVGSQGKGWRAFTGKAWPPPAWFDSMPMDVVKCGPTGAVLRTDVHRGGDWAVRLERSFALCGDRLLVRQRLLPESVGALGPEALPDDDRRLWSVAQVPRPDRVFLRLAGEGRHVRDGVIPIPVPTDRPGWVSIDVAAMDGEGKLSADGDRLAVPLADGSGWCVLSQAAPARHLSAFATPGRAMVFASKPDERPSPYAELEFAAYGPDAEQTVEFRIADDPFGPDIPVRK